MTGCLGNFRLTSNPKTENQMFRLSLFAGNLEIQPTIIFSKGVFDWNV